MATYKDVMRWVAELDVRDAVKGFKKLEDEGKKSLDSVGDEVDKVEGRFGGLTDKFKGIGGKLGGALSGGFAALGVGALMVSALEKSWEAAGGIRKITAQFRLSSDEAAKYGKAAGELYADNWGDSLVDVQQVVATTAQRLNDITGSSLEDISSQIIAVSDTWGEDYEAIIRSITQLTQNDLAKTSQDALDLIVTGFQDGANEAGDLLDTIDEYSQHWGAMGLSGEDALNMIVDGFRNGQRDADKMADAVKEMGLRVREGSEPVRKALEDIGLDAEAVIEAFNEGGPAAREAFLQVIDALKETSETAGGKEGTQAAVALIGTQFEDLGPTALDSLGTVQGALSDTEDAARRAAEQVGEVNPWRDMQRDAETWLGRLGGFLNDSKIGQTIRNISDSTDVLTQRFGDNSEAAKLSTEEIDYWTDRMVTASEEAEHHAGVIDEMTEAQTLVEDAITDAREATERKAEADRIAEEAARRHRQEIRHFKDEISALKREVDDRQAWLNLQGTLQEVAEQQLNMTDLTREQELAVLDLKEEVLDYAESINLPDRVVTSIIADIDQGKLGDVEALLERLGNGITLPIRPVVIGGRGGSSPFTGGVRVDEHGNVKVFPGNASGTTNSPGGPTVVGERGPELVDLPRGSRVRSASETITDTRNAGSGQVVERHIHLNVSGQLDQRAVSQLVEQIKAWERGVL